MGRVFLKDLDFKMIKLLYVDVAEVNKPNLLLINLLAINAGNKVSTNTLIVVSCVIALNNPHKYHYTSLCEVIEKSLAVIFFRLFSQILHHLYPPLSKHRASMSDKKSIQDLSICSPLARHCPLHKRRK